jgi:hypothetical protein
MLPEKVTKYYEMLSQWMAYFGFSPITVHKDAEIDLVFKRSGFEASKFGKADYYCCVKYLEKADPESYRLFSGRMYDLAMKHRTGAPVGFGAMLVVYPLIVTENISQELYNETKLYCPKHFASNEFPSVIDQATGYVYFYEQTPLWGSAYYANFRREAYKFFSPKAWETAGKIT